MKLQGLLRATMGKDEQMNTVGGIDDIFSAFSRISFVFLITSLSVIL